MIDALRHTLEPHTTLVLFTMVFGLLALRVPIGVSLGLPAMAGALLLEARGLEKLSLNWTALAGAFLLAVLSGWLGLVLLKRLLSLKRFYWFGIYLVGMTALLLVLRPA